MTATTRPPAQEVYGPAYAHRPDYVPEAIEALLRITGIRPGARVCDIGAGSGHLTEPLARAELLVDAVEPAPVMRELGRRRTAALAGVSWSVGTGERTGRPGGHYQLVTFGSSFDLTDRAAALAESARLLAPGGWLACLWNHRDLTDPLQARIHQAIEDVVPGYDPGTRARDQRPVIDASGLFGVPVTVAARRVLPVAVEPWCAAWTTHRTVAAHCGDRFPEVLARIREVVAAEGRDPIAVPYETRIVAARRRDAERG